MLFHLINIPDNRGQLFALITLQIDQHQKTKKNYLNLI